MHSQKLSEQFLKPWIVTKSDGSIICAHCNCMAGLGETCTHVCAVLFYLDVAHRRSLEISPTDIKACWVVPSKASEPKRAADIDFAIPSTSKSNVDQPLFIREKKLTEVPPLNKEEMNLMLMNLKETRKGCVLHAIVPPFSEEIKEMHNERTTHMFSSLYKLEYEQETLEKLVEIGK